MGGGAGGTGYHAPSYVFVLDTGTNHNRHAAHYSDGRADRGLRAGAAQHAMKTTKLQSATNFFVSSDNVEGRLMVVISNIASDPAQSKLLCLPGKEFLNELIDVLIEHRDAA
jgi:hypothetical protein